MRKCEAPESLARIGTPTTTNPETPSGYDTVGGQVSPPTAASPINIVPRSALGFKVGTVTFDFPVSPSSEGAMDSPVHTAAAPTSSPEAPLTALVVDANATTKIEEEAHQEQPSTGDDERSESTRQGRIGEGTHQE